MPMHSNRPIPQYQKTRARTVLDIIALVGVLLTLVEFIILWPPITGKVPMHMNFLGQVDNSGPKGLVVFFPIFVLGVYFLFAFLCKHPDKMNYPWPITEENAGRMYQLSISLLTWLRAEVIWLFFLIQHSFLQLVNNTTPGFGWLVILALVFLLGTVFYHLYLLLTTR